MTDLFKAILFILSFQFLGFDGLAQLSADAGPDKVVCLLQDSVILGGFPAATGGNAPYKYTWEINPSPYIPFPTAPNIKVYASDILNDTTASNPLIISSPGSRGPIKLVLTVTDSMGSVSIDSVQIRWTGWVLHPANTTSWVHPGDTVSIHVNAFGGGYPPYVIDWGDSDSLLGPRYDSGVMVVGPNYSRQVIIPDTFFIIFPIRIFDSEGCWLDVGSEEQFMVLPSRISEPEESSSINWYLENEGRILTIIHPSKELQVISLHSVHGKKYSLPNRTGSHGKTHMDLSGIPPGMLVICFSLDGEPYSLKLFQK